MSRFGLKDLTFLNRRAVSFYVCFGLLAMSTACSNKNADEEKSAPPSGSGAPAAVILRDGVTFTADPDPIIAKGNIKLGKTTLSWRTPVKGVQIRLGAPDGTLFTISAGVQQAQTGEWVTNGMTFYLQDNTAINPTDSSATLAKLTLAVK